MGGLTKLRGRVYLDEDILLNVVGDTDPQPAFPTFEVYQYLNPQSDVQILVPELNFFPILRQTIATGRREGYFNIRLGEEPSPMLFLPPVGAAVATIPAQEAGKAEQMK